MYCLFFLLFDSSRYLTVYASKSNQVLCLTIYIIPLLYSARLKMLSAEIDKLREEFVRANQEKVQQQVPPPVAPPQQPQDQYYDQYFDPTEDPMAFMRGPRRRANSFSGHGGRFQSSVVCFSLPW